MKKKIIFAAIGVGLCLAAGVGGCFVIQGSYGPEPFVLGDEEIEAGCVSFPDDQPPTTLSLKAFPAEAIANLKDWSAHLNEGLSATFVTYVPGVTVDFEKVRTYCYEDSVVVMDKRDGESWKQYCRRATPHDKAVRAMLFEERRKLIQCTESKTKGSR